MSQVSPTPSASPAGSIRESLRQRTKWRLAETFFWLATVAALALLPRHYLLLNEIAILALFALSLDLVLGYAGIVSLGHAAYFGLGAYAAGIFALKVNPDPLLGLAFATLISAVAGFLTSFLILRGSDLTRLMVTLGIGMVLAELANSLGWLTGGADGLLGISMSPVLGLFKFDLYGLTAYCYSLLTLFCVFLVVRRVVGSPFGLSVLAIRDNPLRARAIGVPVGARLVRIYTLAAACAGIAGALLAQTTQFVSLDVLDFHRSADVMLVLIIGGTGYLYGGMIGALIFKVMQDVIASLTPQYWQFWIGLILVLFMLAGRERITDGIAGLVRRLVARDGGTS